MTRSTRRSPLDTSGPIGPPFDRTEEHAPTRTLPRTDEPPLGRPFWVWMLICIPTLVAGSLLRLWVLHSPLLPLNSDDAVTGLQGYDVLKGQFRLMVGGNSYGGSPESFLVAPLLAFWSGAAPLRLLYGLLSAVAAGTVVWMARPVLGSNVALTVGLVSFVSSGAAVMVWSHTYMGYPAGMIGLIVTIGCAVRQMTREASWPLSFAGGFAAGFAIWCHPIFGAVALLALVAPAVRNIRSVRWWVGTAVGGVLGVSPWLIYMVRWGLPIIPTSQWDTTYWERIGLFATELLPHAFGMGPWIGPHWVAVTVTLVLIAGSLTGLLMLVARRGAGAIPIAVAGFGAFPVLALFPLLAYTDDGRYSLPFMPALLVGLFAWIAVAPRRARNSAWLPALLPVVWAALLCVPVLQQQVGWTWADPNVSAERLAGELRQSGVVAVRGEYWAVYLLDYLDEDQLESRPDAGIRLNDDADRALAVPDEQTAWVFTAGSVDAGRATLPLPRESYERVLEGGLEAWIPAGTGVTTPS